MTGSESYPTKDLPGESMTKLLAYAQLVRLPNTFTAMADILLGALAAHAMGALSGRWPAFLCLLAASTLLYWSGMIWNDYFDLDQDRKERPGRPLASGRVALSTAMLLGLVFMAGGLLLAFLAGLRIETRPDASGRPGRSLRS